MNLTENQFVVTVIKIEKENVDYTGHPYFNGGDISTFPSKPVIGKKYIVEDMFYFTEVLDYIEN